MPDSVYLTPSEWQDLASGVNFTGISTADQEALIARASRLVNKYIGQSLLLQDYVNEQHPWRDSTHRVYLHNWPVTAVDAVRLRVGPSTPATISATDLYINKAGRYVEISTLALAFGIAPEIVSLGLLVPEVEVDYSAGYGTIPDDVKDAVAIVATSLSINKGMVTEGAAGAVSYTIGSYMVSFGTKDLGGVAGLSNYMPDQAKELLRDYKFTTLR